MNYSNIGVNRRFQHMAGSSHQYGDDDVSAMRCGHYYVDKPDVMTSGTHSRGSGTGCTCTNAGNRRLLQLQYDVNSGSGVGRFNDYDYVYGQGLGQGQTIVEERGDYDPVLLLTLAAGGGEKGGGEGALESTTLTFKQGQGHSFNASSTTTAMPLKVTAENRSGTGSKLNTWRSYDSYSAMFGHSHAVVMGNNEGERILLKGQGQGQRVKAPSSFATVNNSNRSGIGRPGISTLERKTTSFHVSVT